MSHSTASTQSASLPQVQSFNSPIFGNIRTLEIEGEPWFVAKDVCVVLGTETRDIPDLLDHDEQKPMVGIIHTLNDNSGLRKDSRLISESGLYALILRSRKPQAKAFSKWVRSEVLPSIRKHGGYIAQQENLSPEEVVANALVVAQRIIEEKTEALSRANDQIKLDRHKVVFADSISVCESTILVGELAKLVKQGTGKDIGQKRMFDWLRYNGFLHKKGSDRNMPTQKSMDMGLFVIKEGTRAGSNGVFHITKTPKVTGKGQIYFVNRFKEQNDMVEAA